MPVNRSIRPLAAKLIKFAPPKFKKLELKNGRKVYLIKKDELPITRLNILINSGSKFDPEFKRGVSNLTAMCLDEGAGNLDSLQLADQFEYLGARFGIHSNNDNTFLSLQTLTENFDEALKLLSSVILSPHLKEKDFLREKRKVQTRVEQLRDDPAYAADIAFEHFLFGKENPYAYPVMGIPDCLEKIEAEDIKKFYRRNFNPGSSSIIITGNFDEKNIIEKIRTLFANWQTGLNDLSEIPTSQSGKKKVYVIHKKDAVQTEIRTGHLTEKRSDKDYFQKQLLNLILGGQFSSRLNLNLREKHGYTYGINSRFNYLKDEAHFSVLTSVGIENTAHALDEIFTELTKIQEGVTKEELDFAKSSITKRFPLNFETYSQIATIFGNKVIHNLPDDYFEKFIENILSVKIDEVNYAASKSIIPENAVTVLVGDEKIIIDQIKDGNFGEIVSLNYDEIFSK